MVQIQPPVESLAPPRLPKEKLPTMYDLPSEYPEEPGLPDEFHDLQPELLRVTFCPPHYSPQRIFSGSDLNIYYDLDHPRWHKRPDWFGVVGVSRFYDETDLRLSYVIWQEEVIPTVVVELLSPGTEQEDLGKTERDTDEPPTKWDVYEQILQIPYYIVFSRYTNQLRVFVHQAGQYQELALSEPRIWIPELELGLGVWQGVYQGIERLWLRWYDAQSNWIPTEVEKTEAAEQRASEADLLLGEAQQQIGEAQQRASEAERRASEAEQRAEALAQRLLDLGIEP